MAALALGFALHRRCRAAQRRRVGRALTGVSLGLAILGLTVSLAQPAAHCGFAEEGPEEPPGQAATGPAGGKPCRDALPQQALAATLMHRLGAGPARPDGEKPDGEKGEAATVRDTLPPLVILADSVVLGGGLRPWLPVEDVFLAVPGYPVALSPPWADPQRTGTAADRPGMLCVLLWQQAGGPRPGTAGRPALPPRLRQALPSGTAPPAAAAAPGPGAKGAGVQSLSVTGRWRQVRIGLWRAPDARACAAAWQPFRR
jgi:hypothetical protein